MSTTHSGHGGRPQKHDEERIAFNFRVPRSLVGRINQFALWRQGQNYQTVVSRTDAIKLLLETGLAHFEGEYATQRAQAHTESEAHATSPHRQDNVLGS